MGSDEYEGDELVDVEPNSIRIWENNIMGIDFSLDGPSDTPIRIDYRARCEIHITGKQAKLLGEWLLRRAGELDAER